jgi:ElaB/YqjD/DUF883 family membrane-anchored ribosome-binding protein
VGIKYNKEYKKKDGRVLVSSGPRNMQNRSVIDMNEILELRAELDYLKSKLNERVDEAPITSEKTIQSFSQDQVDDLINKTAEEVSLEVESNFKKKIEESKAELAVLYRELEVLRDKLADKDNELMSIRNNYEDQLSASRDRMNRQQAAFEERESNLYLKLDDKDKTIKDLTNKLADISTRPVNVMSYDKASESVEAGDRPAMDNIYIDPSKKGYEDKMESHVVNKETKSNKHKVTSDVDKLKNLMGGLPKRK